MPGQGPNFYLSIVSTLDLQISHPRSLLFLHVNSPLPSRLHLSSATEHSNSTILHYVQHPSVAGGKWNTCGSDPLLV
jgi:hypothetical protein